MLETIREYAAERLRSSGEAGDIQRAHVLYYLSLAEATQPETLAHTQQHTQQEWWAPLEEEHNNLWVALRWTIQVQDEDNAARLALALWRFWIARHLGEGQWLEAALALSGAGDAAPQARRRTFLLLVAGILAELHGYYDRAVALNEESLDLYRDLGHRKSTHGPLRGLGVVAYRRGL